MAYGRRLNHWDEGKARTPYCCSFHWLRLPDERALGLDVIRSDDRAELGLRAFVVEADGAVRGLSFTAPDTAWEPFAIERRPPLASSRPSIGRGADWIAGSVEAGGALGPVRFDLTLRSVSREHSWGLLWRAGILNLSAADTPRVRTQGWVEIGGERHTIDSVGPASTHFGVRLLAYAYCATIPRVGAAAAPQILATAFAADNLKRLRGVLRSRVLSYGFGAGGVPARMVGAGAPSGNEIALGLAGRVELSGVRRFDHDLLGLSTSTASAHAVLRRWRRPPVDLGRVVVDHRGAPFVELLRS